MLPIIGILAFSQTPATFEANLLPLLKADGFDKKFSSSESARYSLAVGQSKGPLKLTISARFFDSPTAAGAIDRFDASGAYAATKSKLKSGELIERYGTHERTFAYRVNLRKAYVYVVVSNADKANKKPIKESKSDAIGKEALEDVAIAIKKSTVK